MLHFALVQKEQESLPETEPLPQQGGQQGGTDLELCHRNLMELLTTFASCLAQTTSTAGFPLTSLWTQGMAIICTGWINLGSDNQEKRSHSELKRCYETIIPKGFSYLGILPIWGQTLPGKGMLPLPQVFCMF